MGVLPEGPGLAAKYRDDSGIEHDPAVVFVEHFPSGKRGLPCESFGFEGGPTVRVTRSIDQQPDIDSLKLQLEIRKRQAEVTKEAAHAALTSGAKGELGFAKEIAVRPRDRD